MKNITWVQAEKRMLQAWNWFMKTDEPMGNGKINPRWETFRLIRDRLRPYRMPLKWRIEMALCGLSGNNLSSSTLTEMKDNGIYV